MGSWWQSAPGGKPPNTEATEHRGMQGDGGGSLEEGATLVNDGQVDKAADPPPPPPTAGRHQQCAVGRITGMFELVGGAPALPSASCCSRGGAAPASWRVLPSRGRRVDCISGPGVPWRLQSDRAPCAPSPHCHLLAGHPLAGTPQRGGPLQSAGASWPDLRRADSRKVPVLLPLYLAS